jgi:hypothetical protein
MIRMTMMLGAAMMLDQGGCDARVDFGDGTYIIKVRGAGAMPCDASQQSTAKVAGEPKRKAAPKKTTKKEEAK